MFTNKNGGEGRRNMIESELSQIIRPGETRGLDFVILDELRKRTGINPDAILKFALGETLCNALDKDSTEIMIDMQIDGDFYKLTISDNGTKKLAQEELHLILDFENKASSKRGFHRVSRGYLGNALKCIFGYSYALAEALGLPSPDIIVKSASCEHRIALKPDRVKGVINSEISSISLGKDDGLTTFIVKFPKAEVSLIPYPELLILKDMLFATSMVNPNRRINYNIFNLEKGTLGLAVEGMKAIRQETSILWYTQKQFQSLYEDFIRARPETQLKEFLPLFRGFSRKPIIRDILQKLNSCNHDSGGNSSLHFVPSTTIKDLSRSLIIQLFALMKEDAKAINKRSVPSVLGMVGEENFERVREQHRWQRVRYMMLPGIRRECPEYYHGDGPCKNYNHVEFPYLVELAIFDRKEDDNEGLKVLQCVNFMASMENIFSRIFDIPHRLGLVGIREDTPVTVVVHLVSPVLKWLNYGKSGLDE